MCVGRDGTKRDGTFFFFFSIWAGDGLYLQFRDNYTKGPCPRTFFATLQYKVRYTGSGLPVWAYGSWHMVYAFSAAGLSQLFVFICAARPRETAPSPVSPVAQLEPPSVPRSDQPFCGVCAAPFTLMVRRQRCQVCGESVCAQCSSDKRHVEGTFTCLTYAYLYYCREVEGNGR